MVSANPALVWRMRTTKPARLGDLEAQSCGRMAEEVYSHHGCDFLQFAIQYSSILYVHIICAAYIELITIIYYYTMTITIVIKLDCY